MRVPVPAPFDCVVAQHCARVGQEVSPGQDVVACEAMKMEVPVASPAAGTVAWLAPLGSVVRGGEPVAEVERG